MPRRLPSPSGLAPLVAHPVVYTGMALIAVQLAFRGWAVLNGWFYSDDFEFLSEAVGRRLSLGYLFTPHDVHLMPGGVLLSWLVAHAGAFNWTAAGLVLLVLQLLADLACLGMLCVLFGRRWWILLPLGYYLFSSTTLTAFMWWSAAVNQVPMHLCFFVVVTLHVLYLRSGRTIVGMAGVGALVVGLAFFEKSLLILLPLGLLTLLYFGVPGEGPWSRVTGTVVRHWRVLAAYGVVALAYVVGYLVAVPTTSDVKGDVDYLGLLDSMLRVSLVVSSLGGPWTWSDRNPPLGQVATPGWAAVAALVVLVVALLLSLRARRGGWRALVLAASYVLVTWFLLTRARGAALGSFAGLELRYLADAAPVLTLALGLLAMRLRPSPTAAAATDGAEAARTVRGPRRLVAVTVLAALVVGAIVSDVAYARMWTADFPAKAFTKATQGSVGNEPLDVLDEPVPELVMSATSYPSNLPSRLFAPLGKRFAAHDRGTDLTILGSTGLPYGAVVSGGRQSEAGPAKGCGYPLTTAPTQVAMTGPSAPYFWWLELSYLASARGDIEVTVGGTTHTVEVRRGPHRYFLRGEGASSTVSVALATEGLAVCLDTVHVGRVGALEPIG